MVHRLHGHSLGPRLDYSDDVRLSGHKELLRLAWRATSMARETDTTTGRHPVVKAETRQQWRDEIDLARTLASLYTFS